MVFFPFRLSIVPTTAAAVNPHLPPPYIIRKGDEACVHTALR